MESTRNAPVKLFHTHRQRGSAWLIEVDYGSGWFVYGPPYPERSRAESLARELRSHGHEVRVTAVGEAQQPSGRSAN